MNHHRAFLIVAFMAVGLSLNARLPAQEPRVVPGPPGEASAEEKLARRSGCFECHSVDDKVVGPAYRDGAARYQGGKGGTVESETRGFINK